VTNRVTEIFTIGHSTHTAEQFLKLLRLHNIAQLADVRTVPRSRRHPHFAGEALDNFLRAEGIIYRHFPSLGGLRKPHSNSVNTAWQHPSFRGYADHMQSAEFARGLLDLRAFARQGPTVVMCAEAVWWQCHRRLLADALLANDVPVRHIQGNGQAKPHQMSEFARVSGTVVTYPGLL
jgi:uncharacterized protein (DUF488 family)